MFTNTTEVLQNNTVSSGIITNTTEVLQNNTVSSGIIFVIPLLKIKFSQNHLKRNIKQFFSISFFKKKLLQFKKKIYNSKHEL